MDGDDDYMPQMSQLGGDYGAMGGGMGGGGNPYGHNPYAPQPSTHQGMTNPYGDPIMHQMQTLHPIGAPPIQQPPPAPQPPAKQTKSRSKKKEAAAAAQQAQQQAQQQSQMGMGGHGGTASDPMASMAAMSHNPMRTSMPMQQMPMEMQRQQMMYGGGGQGVPPQGTWAAPPQTSTYPQAAHPQHPQTAYGRAPGGYPGQPYPAMGYPPQQQRPPGYAMPPTNPYGAYPPSAYPQYPGMGRYPAQPGPTQMPSQYGYPDPSTHQPTQGYPSYPATSAAQTSMGSTSVPTSEHYQQQMHPNPYAMPQHHQPAPYNPQMIGQMQMEVSQLHQRIQHLYQQQRTPMIEQEVHKCEQRIAYLQSQLSAAGTPNPYHHPQTSQASAGTPVANPMSGMMPAQQPQNPVSVTQSGSQVQVNIKPDFPGKTLISVYHQNYPDGNGPNGSGGFEAPKDSVPPEPVPSSRSPPQPQPQQSVTSSSMPQLMGSHPHASIQPPPPPSTQSQIGVPPIVSAPPGHQTSMYPTAPLAQHAPSMNGHASASGYGPQTTHQMPPHPPYPSTSMGQPLQPSPQQIPPHQEIHKSEPQIEPTMEKLPMMKNERMEPIDRDATPPMILGTTNDEMLSARLESVDGRGGGGGGEGREGEDDSRDARQREEEEIDSMMEHPPRAPLPQPPPEEEEEEEKEENEREAKEEEREGEREEEKEEGDEGEEEEAKHPVKDQDEDVKSTLTEEPTQFVPIVPIVEEPEEMLPKGEPIETEHENGHREESTIRAESPADVVTQPVEEPVIRELQEETVNEVLPIVEEPTEDLTIAEPEPKPEAEDSVQQGDEPEEKVVEEEEEAVKAEEPEPVLESNTEEDKETEAIEDVDGEAEPIESKTQEKGAEEVGEGEAEGELEIEDVAEEGEGEEGVAEGVADDRLAEDRLAEEETEIETEIETPLSQPTEEATRDTTEDQSESKDGDEEKTEATEEPVIEEEEEEIPEPSTSKTPKAKATNKKTPGRKSSKKSSYVEYWDDDDIYERPSNKKSKKATSTTTKKKSSKREKYIDDEEIPPEFLDNEKRRSGRRGGTKSYAEPSMDEFDQYIIPDSEAGTPLADEDEDSLPLAVHMPLVVEKILAVRNENEENEEFYVKWKGRSYMHCEWQTQAQLEDVDKRVQAKIKRYKQKRASGVEDEEVNDDFLVVDRVLAMDYQDDGDYALVKWKSLPYDEVTWETVEVVPEEKIEQWKKWQKIDKAKAKEKARPEAGGWKKLPSNIEWKNGNCLREYQFDGVNWLTYCYYHRQNCILADEMGLGKTVQTITFLSRVYEYGIHGPFLIVVPLSTIHNWVREFETWTDMNAVVYHGSYNGRQIIENNEIYYSRPDEEKEAKLWRKNLVKFDALITTFEMVVTEVEFLRKINWKVCIIDEAHRLKNRNCKLLTGGLLSLRMDHRVLLTGTPLQNNVEELFSLLNFLHPEQFANSEAFLEKFGQCKTDEQVTQLQQILKPMMLRRLKEDVEKSLQPREEVIIEVQLSDAQKKYYRAILEKNFTHLCKGTTAPSLMNVMMELRKCCNHPFLIQGAEEQIVSEVRLLHPELDEDLAQRKALVDASGKMVLIEKLLPKLKQDGHRVLVFSQMVKVLDLIEEFVTNMGYLYERIDGNVRGDLRQAAIDRFSRKDSDRFLFLLCTRAGGLGINLTAADTVIIFDSDWNPQNDLQAQARCHRIGQDKMVKVYRLITANTYEREMFDKASLKLGLDKAVLQSTTVMEKKEQLTKKEIEELLKKGAYGSIMDESNEGSKFSEEDIETILQRRATTITLEAGAKGSTFSKASFGSSNNTDEIDIDDPNFWTKWAEKANIDLEKVRERQSGKQLIVSEPRNRKKRFEEDTLKEGDGSGSDESEDAGKRRTGTDREERRRARKRRKDDDDDEYVRYRPDELAFNKSDYFKIEKLIGSYGWGRWQLFKEQGDMDATEIDIEHLARTLLLHNLRDFRGDERTREYVYAVIEPKDARNYKQDSKNKLASGWAALPEYNPPNFVLDTSFQRHIHRYSNKLISKVEIMHFLFEGLLKERKPEVEEGKKADEIDLVFLPPVEPMNIDNWDNACDKSLIIGTYKHGMENPDAMKSDETLCFTEKGIDVMPTGNEIFLRLKRIQQRTAQAISEELAAKQPTKWPKSQEVEFVRLIATFPIKDWDVDITAVDWSAVRKRSPVFDKKSDADLQAHMFAVLAQCFKAKGAAADMPSAFATAAPMSDDLLNANTAQSILNRLQLLKKISMVCANGRSGLDAFDEKIALCPKDGLPSGWTDDHDKELLMVANEYGIKDISVNILGKTLFQKIIRPAESLLFKRVIDLSSTLLTGKYSPQDPQEYQLDELQEEKQPRVDATQQQMQQLLAAHLLASATPSTSTTSNQRSSTNRGRKRPAAKTAQETVADAVAEQLQAAMLQQMVMAAGQTGSAKDSAAAQQLLLILALQQQAASQQQQQQQQTSRSSTSSSSANNDQATQLATMAALLACASQEDLAALGLNAQQKQALLAMLAAQASGTSTASTPAPSTPAPTPQASRHSSTPSTSKNTTSKVSSSTTTAASTSATSRATSEAQAMAALAAAAGLSASSSGGTMTEAELLLQLQVAQLAAYGLTIQDYVLLSNMPPDTKVPCRHRTTGELLPADQHPTIATLIQFLEKNTQYKVDLRGDSTAATPQRSKTATPALSTPKPAATPTPVPTPTPKPVESMTFTEPSTSLDLSKPEADEKKEEIEQQQKKETKEKKLEPGEIPKTQGVVMSMKDDETKLIPKAENKEKKKEKERGKSQTPPALCGSIQPTAATGTPSNSTSNAAASVAAANALAQQQAAALAALANPSSASSANAAVQQQAMLLALMQAAATQQAQTSTSSSSTSAAKLQQAQLEALQMQSLLQQAFMLQAAQAATTYSSISGLNPTSSSKQSLEEQQAAALYQSLALMGMGGVVNGTQGSAAANAAATQQLAALMADPTALAAFAAIQQQQQQAPTSSKRRKD